MELEYLIILDKKAIKDNYSCFKGCFLKPTWIDFHWPKIEKFEHYYG